MSGFQLAKLNGMQVPPILDKCPDYNKGGCKQAGGCPFGLKHKCNKVLKNGTTCGGKHAAVHCTADKTLAIKDKK